MRYGYIAVVISPKGETKHFVAEVVAAIRALPNAEVNLGAAGDATTIVPFICGLDPERMRREAIDLWRRDAQVWVFEAGSVVQGTAATEQWIARRVAR